MSWVPSVICMCGALAGGPQQDREQLGPRVAGAVGVGELERDDGKARDLLVEAEDVGERLLHRGVQRDRAVRAGVVVLPDGPGVHERAVAGLADGLGERGAEPDVRGDHRLDVFRDVDAAEGGGEVEADVGLQLCDQRDEVLDVSGDLVIA